MIVRLHCYAAMIATVPLALAAQPPRPKLFAIHPAGIQAGKSAEVTLVGERIEQLKSLHFSSPGVSATFISPGKFRVAAEPSLRPQTVDVVGLSGAGSTNPRSFELGDLETVLDTEPNDLRENAQSVQLNQAVHGRMDARADVDYFQLRLPANTRAVVHVKAATLDSRLAPVLTASDDRNVTLARTEEYGDPATPMIVGPYASEKSVYIRLHDLVYNGGPEYWYRLEILTGPFVWFAWPPIVKADGPSRIHLVGWNLPNGSPVVGSPAGGFSKAHWSKLAAKGCEISTLDVQPADIHDLPGSLHIPPVVAAGDSIILRPAHREFSDLLAAVARFPIAYEIEPNDKPGDAQVLTQPCELIGTFDSLEDRDWYRISAQKGDRIEVVANAERLGFPGDLAVSIHRLIGQEGGKPKLQTVEEFDDDGNNPGEKRFYLASIDAVGGFTASEGGEYLIGVSDRQGPCTPRSIYRLRIGPPVARARTFVLPWNEDAPEGIALETGGRTALRAIVHRSGGQVGSISFSASANPAIGQTRFDLPAGSNVAAVVLSANPAAAAGLFPLSFQPTSDADPKVPLPMPLMGTILWPGDKNAYKPARVARFSNVAVSASPAPYRLEVPAELRALQGSLVRIDLLLDRKLAEFTGPLTEIKPMDAPNFLEVTPASIPDKQALGQLAVRINKSAPPGVYRFAVAGIAKMPWPQNVDDPKSAKAEAKFVEPSNLLALTIAPAPFELVIEKNQIVVKAGQAAEIQCKLRRRKPFDGPVKLGLTLPAGLHGIAAEPTAFVATQTEAKLTIRVDAAVPPGDKSLITIRATALADGMSVDEPLTVKVEK